MRLTLSCKLDNDRNSHSHLHQTQHGWSVKYTYVYNRWSTRCSFNISVPPCSITVCRMVFCPVSTKTRMYVPSLAAVVHAPYFPSTRLRERRTHVSSLAALAAISRSRSALLAFFSFLFRSCSNLSMAARWSSCTGRRAGNRRRGT